MFLPDANTNPYPDPSSSTSTSTSGGPRPSVKYANTRLHDDDPSWAAGTSGTSGENSKRSSSSVRGSSPSRSLIDAAVRGTSCKYLLFLVSLSR